MIRNGVSEPSSKPSRKTASCSGAGLTGRFGLSNLNLPQPHPLMCLSIRWVPRTTQRHSWTCLRGRRKRLGGLRWTGKCGSSPCCLEKRRWPHNNCQSRTSWSTKTLSTPSSSGSPSPKQHRQRFRSLDLRECCQTFTMAQQLRDACRRCLMAEESEVEEVIDKVVLEQFMVRLQRKTAQWAQCHRCGDPGHFIGRCPVKEVETLIRVPDTPAKNCCAFARALLLYPHRGAGCAWRNTHANRHWLVLLTLEGDWALRRDPISQSL